MPARRRARAGSKRPPKKWWDHCVAAVKAAGKRARHRARSPEAVCGAEWYKKMGPTAKKRAKKRHPEHGRAAHHTRKHRAHRRRR